MAIQQYIKKTPNTDVITYKSVRNFAFLILILKCSSGLAQTIYPPNFSFEDDTNYISIAPWKWSGDIGFTSAIGMNLPPHGKAILGMYSVKKVDTIISTYIYNTFPINSRPKFLEFYSFYSASDLRDKFKTKLKLFKNDVNGKPISICILDSMMDTSTFYFNYRPNWVHVKIPLEKYYLNELIPDSCYLEINAGLFFDLGFNNGHSLSIDKITLAGTAFVSVPENYMESKNIVIYPNPASKVVKIDFEGKGKLQNIDIVDALGRTVIQQETNTNKVEVDVSCLKSGCYIVKIKDLDGLEFLQKLLIETN